MCMLEVMRKMMNEGLECVYVISWVSLCSWFCMYLVSPILSVSCAVSSH